MMRFRAAAITLVFLCSVCQLNAAPADLVITIRDGTVSIPYKSARPRFAVAGPAVDLDGVFDDGAFRAENCQPCLAGSVVSLDGSISGTASGKQFIIASNFTFSSADLRVPEDGRSDVTLTAPFTIEGEVTLAHVREPAPEDALLRATIVGSGTATVHLSSVVDPDTGTRLYFFQGLTYEFTAGPV